MALRNSRSDLIGRGPELESLASSLRSALSRTPTTVIVGGEAGIGKSRLVGEFIDSIGDGPIVVRGQCVDLGTDAPPYAPVTSALRSLVAAVGDESLLEAAGPAADAIGVLLPHLVHQGGTREGGAERLYEGVALTLENVSHDRPIVLVIEDVHWADRATLALLRFLVRVVEHGRILFLLTYRDDDVKRDQPLARWLPELERSPRTTRIPLGRLDKEQVRMLVASRLGGDVEAGDLASVFSRSEGNPFFVEELVDAAHWDDGDLPRNLRDVLLARYEGLSGTTQRVMRILAAGGSRVEHELLQTVIDQDPSTLDDAVREAVQANLISADDRGYQFRHALVRDAIHAELLPGERVRFHSAYASALESGSGTGSAFSEVSYHWMIAHDSRSAFRASIAAMEQARTDFAYATAAQMGERALELWASVPDALELADRTRRDLLAQTANALRNAGESERAVALVDEAIADTGDDIGRAGLLRSKASYLANLGRLGSIDLLEEAVALLQCEGPNLTRAIVLGELAARLMLAGRTADAVRTSDLALEEADRVDSHPRMSVALNIRGTSKVISGDVDDGLADLAAAGELAVGDDSARLRYRVNLSDAFHVIGRFDEAVKVAVEGTEKARERGLERTSGAILMSNTVEPLFALGQWTRANEILDRALALEPPIGFSAHLQRLKLWWLLWSGDTAGAAASLRRWRRSLSLQLETEVQSQLAFARVAAEIALESDDLDTAWAEARVILSPDRSSLPAWELPLLAIAARILAEFTSTGRALPEGEPSAVEATMRATLERSSDWPNAGPFLALFEAELAHRDIALWRSAVEQLQDRTAHAHMLPYARVRLAESLAVVGHRSDAEHHAHAARVRAREIGAGLIVRRADDLRRRIGAASTGPSSDDHGLTAREHQVMDLVTLGMSNGEIATKLFISPKTASVHVSSILRKLGASSRTEAVHLTRRVADRAGAPDG